MTLLWVLCSCVCRKGALPVAPVGPPVLAPGLTERENAQLVVLRHLAAGGHAALRQMAAQRGQSEDDFLREFAGVPRDAPFRLPPGLF